LTLWNSCSTLRPVSEARARATSAGRRFLVPVAAAVAALAPGAAAGGTPSHSTSSTADTGRKMIARDRLTQPLLALGRGARHLAGVMGHVSHSSHVSHASHVSHFSSSTSPPASPPSVSPSPPASSSVSSTASLSAFLDETYEVPGPSGTSGYAGGVLTATLRGRILSWHLETFSLSGPVTGVWIGVGADGRVGTKLVQLRRSGGGASGTIVLTPAQVAALLTRSVFVNVGTSINPGGETRGDISVISLTSPVVGGSGSSGGHFSHSSHVSHASHVSHYSSY
jgi:hypothetical protein